MGGASQMGHFSEYPAACLPGGHPSGDHADISNPMPFDTQTTNKFYPDHSIDGIDFQNHFEEN
jgi:hypothetical protein